MQDTVKPLSHEEMAELIRQVEIERAKYIRKSFVFLGKSLVKLAKKLFLSLLKQARKAKLLSLLTIIQLRAVNPPKLFSRGRNTVVETRCVSISSISW